MNKKLMMLFVLTVLVVSQVATFAADEAIKLIVDDVTIELDQAPVVINSRVLAPIAVVYKAMGLEYTWDGTTKTVDANKEGISIQIQIDNKTAVVNGEEVEMDVAATAIGGRTLVPVSFIARALDLDVSWDAENQAVVINSDLTATEPVEEDDEEVASEVDENHWNRIPEHDAYSFVESTEFLELVAESYNVITVINGEEKVLSTGHDIQFKFHDKDDTLDLGTNNMVEVLDVTNDQLIYAFCYLSPTQILFVFDQAHEAMNETLSVLTVGILGYENGLYIAEEFALYLDEHTDSKGYFTVDANSVDDDEYYMEGYKVRFYSDEVEIEGKMTQALVGITIE